MKKEKTRKKGLNRLLQLAGTKKWLLLFSILLAIISSLVQFVPFISIYKILSELSTHAAHPELIDKDFIWHWGWITLYAILLYGLFLFSSLMLSHVAAFNILYELRMLMAKKLVKLPLGFFTKKSSGQIKKVMGEDIERIELFVAHHIPDITSAIVFPILILSYMYYVDWRLAIVVSLVFILAISFMSSMSMSSRMKPLVEKYLKTMGNMNNSIVEYVRGIQIVKVFSTSTEAFERLNSDIDEFRDFSNGITRKYSPAYLGFYLLLSSSMLFIIPVAVFLLLRADSYSEYVPTVLLFIILGGGIFFPLLKLMWIGSMMTQNNMGVEKIDEIIYDTEIEECSNIQKPKNSSIVFENVSFAYETKEVLKSISFAANPGTITALVGPSGAGKTTIAMLAARFWDIQSGNIHIGDVSIKNIPTDTLMNHISFVFQDNQLFFDTIEENIRMGNKEASFDELVNAAKIAQCHQFISKLDNEYQTLVGEGGTYLSGGEQQRISLARAILKNSPVLLLDEATAYADPENEAKILESFSHMIKNKTVLVIAHRLSTITNADQILYVDNGRIEEQGTHEELLAMNTKYAKMWDNYSRSRKWVLKSSKQESNEH